MPRLDSPLTTLAIACLLASAVAYAALNRPWEGVRERVASLAAHEAVAQEASKSAPPAGLRTWAASAPGRVEPRGGEIRISPLAGGRIVEVTVAANAVVMPGDLLVRIADDELRIRLAAAEAEAAVRRRERDQEIVKGPALERRQAEDAVAAAERALFAARLDQDVATSARAEGKVTAEDAAKARDAAAAAQAKLEQDRAALRRVAALPAMPLPTRLESSLVSARAEISLIEAAIERTRIRAPDNATVLQVHARVGESVAPTPEAVLVVLGDLSALRVKAEVEERDTAQVRSGQRAVVRSDAFPGKEFEGKVTMVAQALGAARLAMRGPRRPNDVDVLEVRIDLDGRPPLLPGMRVDVFFKSEDAAKTAVAPPSVEAMATRR